MAVVKLFKVLTCLTLFFNSGSADARPDRSVTNDVVSSASGFIVMFRNNVSNIPSVIQNMQSMGIGPAKQTFNTIKAFTFDFPSTASPRAREQSLQRLRADQRVEFVEEDAIVNISQTTLSTETIPTGISYMFQGSPVPISNVPSNIFVRIAIIDTGMIQHPDLNVASFGYSAFSTRQGDWFNDGNGHGTHCAGTAAAIKNTIGVVGMAPNVQLVAVRVLDSRGSGTLSGVIAGMDWVASRPTSDGIKVASMSLGGGASNSLDSAVSRLTAAGVTIVVAAGNSGADLNNYSPARAREAITVTAITDSTRAPSWTNFGIKPNVYAAPGVGILSTWIAHPTCGTLPCYNLISGTSMSTPLVAGLVAQCYSRGQCTSVDSAKSFLADCASRDMPTRFTSTNQHLGKELRMRTCACVCL